MLKSWSKEESSLALSSGETELCPANSGAQQSMRIRSTAADFEIQFKRVDLLVDATAAIGIMSRRSRVDVNELLLQSVEDKKASVAKVGRSSNPGVLGNQTPCSR